MYAHLLVVPLQVFINDGQAPLLAHGSYVPPDSSDTTKETATHTQGVDQRSDDLGTPYQPVVTHAQVVSSAALPSSEDRSGDGGPRLRAAVGGPASSGHAEQVAVTKLDLVDALVMAREQLAEDRKVRSRRICYHFARDVASLVKFLATTVSLGIIIFGSRSLISCDGITLDNVFLPGSYVRDQCNTVVTATSYVYIFISLLALLLLLFIVAIVLDKMVYFVDSAASIIKTWLSALTILAVTVFVFVGLILNVPVYYGCQRNRHTVEAPTQELYGLCRHLTENQTVSTLQGFEFDCANKCSVDFPPAAYSLFASLVLTVVYMLTLIGSYHQEVSRKRRQIAEQQDE